MTEWLIWLGPPVVTLVLCEVDPGHKSPVRLHRAVWVLIRGRR